MTDTDVNVDLDDYLKTLNDLHDEIEEFGSERRSLAEVTAALKKLHASNERVFTDVEQNLSGNASMLDELRSLKLSELQGEVRDRYDAHQQTLGGMATSLRQAVHEQQRAAPEMLQNATHNSQQLERYAERVEAAFATQTESQERILAQLDALTSGQEDVVQQLKALATDHEAIKATQVTSDQRLQVIRTLVITALILILAVGVVAAVV